MSVVALELNDMGLVLARNAELSVPSPGYAHFGRGELVVGEAARAVARLEPLNASHKFWHALDDRPLSLPAAAGRSNADIAFEHLTQVCAPLAGSNEQLIAVVPASVQPRQLMWVLGMAREAALPLAGFIDAGTAAATTLSDRGRIIVVDLHLNEAILTAVEIGEEARRERFESVSQAGWSAFLDLVMKLIASRFVARTRFDPLHDARSEQLLFDKVPDWLAALQNADEIDAQLDVAGEPRSIALTRELIETEARDVYGRIVMAAHRLRRAGHRTTIAISDRAARMPGLLQRFADFHDCDLITLPQGATALAAASLPLSWSIQEDSATLIRSSPLLEPATAAPFTSTVVQRARAIGEGALPSHALYRGVAHALGTRPVVVGTGAPGVDLRITEAGAGISRLHCSILGAAHGDAQVVDHSRYGTWLNDERVIGRAPLRAGDRIRVGNPGVSIEMIAIS